MIAVAACGGSTPQLETADPGVVFTYPIDGQLDVPIGARVVVTFSDPVVASAIGSFEVRGPDGPVTATAEVTTDGRGVQLVGGFEPGTRYEVFVDNALQPQATNLPSGGPLFAFTTRNTRPRAAIPSLIAINGAPPMTPDAFRPMFETSTIRLVFSEPLDPRSVRTGPGAIELVDTSSNTAVPVTLVSSGIHVALDPIDDLAAGTAYELRIGTTLRDLGGSPVTAMTAQLTPQNSLGGKAPIAQVMRTRQPGDPGPELSRAGGERNAVTMDKPLIGRETVTVLPAAIAAELGDPKALGGPIAFTIRRGQRLALSSLEVKLGGEIPANLSTGDIFIEFLTDAGGRLYRNPYQPTDQRPENLNAPLFLDLSMDVAVYTVDPTGNAVIAQTVLGVQATGTAVATDGVLAMEAASAMEMGLLGVTQAPTNLVLELITDVAADAPTDTTAPTLIATSPPEGSDLHAPGDGIELVFDEPVDLDKLRAGLRLEANGVAVPTTIESHGSSVVVRPTSRLPYSTAFSIVLGEVTDVAGNALADTSPIGFRTLQLGGTGVPLTVSAVHPGVPCALTAGGGGVPGRCAGGNGADDMYRSFELPANEPLEIVFSQPVNQSTVVLGTACGTGTVRVELIDGGGTCTGVVAGTMIKRDRGVQFVPDAPWVEGQNYRLALISGGDEDCDGNELCGANGRAASFDPLGGTEDGDGGGPALVIDFLGVTANRATFLFAEASPFVDVNGSGFVDGGEALRDENRAALRIIGTSGDVGDASFDMQDCLPETPEVEGCMYLLGAMPVQLGELERDCALPTGETAPACIPIGLAAQAMFATSLAMDASVGITISAETGTSVMRIREPAGGPVKGFIVDGGNGPKMVVALDLYMDAPDMSLPLSDHDLHSKPLSVVLEGPVTFHPDGRIAISLTNVAEVPVEVNIDAPLGLGGAVRMVLPLGEMKLQLLSRPLRGVEP